MKSLSFVIIAKNEQDWIENCLLSIKDIADEIVIATENNSDDTVKICKKYTKLVFENGWQNFSDQKNFVMKKATGDWLFFIDADERLSAKLAAEIKEVINSDNPKSGYQIPRLNYMLGKPMRHGGWYPDYVTRLARKDKIKGWAGELHEALQIEGELGTLKNPLIHLTHRGIDWMLKKSVRYNPIEANLLFKAKHPPVTWWRFPRVMLGEFFDRLIIKQGFRDGMQGWIEAISQSYNMFLVYVNLWELQKGKSMDQEYKEIDKELKNRGF